MTLSRSRARVVLGLVAGTLVATSLLDVSAPAAHAGDRVVDREDPPPGTVLAIAGPATATLGRTAHLVAWGRFTEGGDVTYRWDLDGDGRYETSSGESPSIDTGFDRGGPRTVGVQADTGAAQQTATLAITVRRPSTAAIQVSPPYAGPGDKVRLSMTTRSDAGPFRAFTWRVEGVKPTRTGAGIRTARPGRKSARGAVSPFLGAEVDLTTSGTNLAVTTSPTLEVRLPSGKKQVGKTLDIVGQALAPDGSLVTAIRRLKLDERPRGLPTSPYPTDKVVDCQDMPPGVPAYPCAQMTASGDLVAGISTYFTNSTPSVEACSPTKDFITGGSPLDKVALKEKQNLPYPSPVDFVMSGFDAKAPAVGGRTARRTGGTGAVSSKGKEKCFQVYGDTLGWTWGDGTSSVGLDGIGHAYSAPGTYTVTMTTKVPYFKVKGQKLFTQVQYFTAKTSMKVTIAEGFCGDLSLNGFVTKARQYKTFGCYVPFKSADGSRTLYRPQEGYGVDVAGLRVEEVAWVDPQAGTIVGGPKGLKAYVTGRTPGTSSQVAKLILDKAPSLVLPPPTYDAGLGDSVTALPPVKIGPGSYFRAVKGIPVAAAQAFVSTTRPPTIVMALDMPAPLGDNTPPVVEQAEYLTASSAGRPSGDQARDVPAGTDFSVDLSNTDLGAFRIKSGGIHHKTAGGWIGDVVIDVDGLGELNAPYKPVPTTSTTGCRQIDGPSGVELNADGSFKSGGAQLIPEEQLPIGPLGLSCVAISGSTDPFVMSGKAELSAPLNGPININACLAASVLKGGQTATGCGATFTAPESSVWFRATGEADLLGILPLADAYLDARVSKNYQSVGFGGSFGFDAGVFRLRAGVNGTIVTAPQTAFDLIGSAELCQVNPIKNLCFDVQGGVSSRGFGACASIGGFVYYWEDGIDFFFASCDLKAKIGVQNRTRRRAAGTVNDLAVPAGIAKTAFVVHRDDDGSGAPLVQVDKAGGGSIVDDGSPVQERSGYTIVKFPEQGVTTVTVTKPQGGTWRVRSRDDGAIRTELMTPVREPVVTAKITGTATTRKLTYDAKLAPGDTILLTETGRSGTRVLARPTRATSSFVIPRAGAAGRRTVYALVYRNGIPYKKIALAPYNALAGVGLAAPSKVTATSVGTGLRVTWPAVPGARGYDVQVRTTSGQVITRRVTDLTVTLPGLGRVADGSVSVVAVGRGGTSSARRTVPLPVVRTIRLRP